MRGVRHGQPGGGHLDQRRTPEVERRGRAHEIARGAAADRHPRVAALAAQGRGGLQQRLRGAQPLVALAGPDEDAPIVRERGHEARQRRPRRARPRRPAAPRWSGRRCASRSVARVEVAAQQHLRLARTHRVVAADARVEQAPAGGAWRGGGIRDARGERLRRPHRRPGGGPRRGRTRSGGRASRRVPRGHPRRSSGRTTVSCCSRCEQHLVGRVQPDGQTRVPQRPAVERVDDRAAARGDDRAAAPRTPPSIASDSRTRNRGSPSVSMMAAGRRPVRSSMSASRSMNAPLQPLREQPPDRRSCRSPAAPRG